MRQRWLPALAGATVVGGGMWLASCASAPTTKSLAADAAAAMGGLERLRGVQTVVMRDGTGTRLRLGQMVHATDPETPSTLSKVTETLDLVNGRAVLDYEIKSGDFTQHRQEILTKKNGTYVGLENVAGRPLAVMSPSGLFSWGTQNHPGFLLARNVITVVLVAAEAASSQAPETRDFAGSPHAYGTTNFASGETIGLYFNTQTKLLDGFEATDIETMLGDQPAVYTLADYRDVAGVKLPHKITIVKGGKPYSEVQFASASVNDPAAVAVFAIPEAANAEVDKAIAAGDYSPVAIARISDGVFFARAYSHNSLVVEFPSYLAVVEAAYTDAQSATLARVLANQFPGKPVRYAAVTHYHYDHTGGVRGLAAVGATILAEKAHEPMMRPIIETPHTNPPDALEIGQEGRQGRWDRVLRGQEGDQRRRPVAGAVRRQRHSPRRADGAGVRAEGRRALPERPVLSGNGRPGGAGCRGAAAGGEGAEAEGHDQRRRPRRRRSVCGTGESGRGRPVTAPAATGCLESPARNSRAAR